NGDWHIKVAIYGYDEKGVPNALKGMVLEKGKSGQPAKPWLKPAVSKTKNQCVDAMHTVLDREVSQL
ncbi:MAG: HK97 gp10 family phage protein, partial [Prevotella sp.]|nr:HK97 gp10 family phage protein [Prevotella sp.]